MAGNADNVKIWTDADVLVYTGPGSPFEIISPATSANVPASITDLFNSTWAYVGMLKGDAGFAESREWSQTDIPAWGYGTVKVSNKDYKDTRKFTAIEDNDTTFDLIWPGSTDTDIVVPKPANRYLAFELTDDEGNKKRLITRKKSQVWAPNWNQVEGNVDGYEFEGRIFPTGDKKLYAVQASVVTP